MTLTAGQQAVKSDEWQLRAVLETAGAKFKGRNTKCPFHDDTTPSAAIFQRDDGYWHFKCNGCGIDGDIFDIQARLNKTAVSEELRKASGETSRPTPAPHTPIYQSLEAISGIIPNVEKVYRYTNPDTGTVDYATIRSIDRNGKKKFTQCSPTAGGWWMKQPQGTLPLYNRHESEALKSS